MHKIIIAAVMFIAVLVIAASYLSYNSSSNLQKVEQTVFSFGKKLQAVSLLAPYEAIKRSIEENYKDFVAPELLASWESDPEKAPGRLTSSPWPDRIDIVSINRNSDNSYSVQGNVVLITSEEMAHGGIASQYPVSIEVKKTSSGWKITKFEKRSPL